MEALTVVIGLIIAALSVVLVAVAIYSIRPTSFEDAMPNYGAKTVIDKTTTKTSKKKTKKSSGNKQSPSGGKSTAGSGQNEPETDEDAADDTSSSEEHDNTSRVKTAKLKKKSQPRKQPSDEDIDLLAYSRNFKSDLTTKIATAAKTAAAIGSAKSKHEVVKKPKAKELVEQVTPAAAVSAKQVPKDEVDSAPVADVSRKPTPAPTGAAATSSASARGTGQSASQKSTALSAKPLAVKESAITRNSMCQTMLTFRFYKLMAPRGNYITQLPMIKRGLTREN